MLPSEADGLVQEGYFESLCIKNKDGVLSWCVAFFTLSGVTRNCAFATLGVASDKVLN